jgi:hypothetical protein
VSLHNIPSTLVEVLYESPSVKGGPNKVKFTVEDGWCEVRVENLSQQSLPFDVVLRFE